MKKLLLVIFGLMLFTINVCGQELEDPTFTTPEAPEIVAPSFPEISAGAVLLPDQLLPESW